MACTRPSAALLCPLSTTSSLLPSCLMATPTARSPQALALSATLTGHTGAVWCVAWSPEGGLLASAGADASVRLWAPPPGVLDGGRGLADGGVGRGKGPQDGPEVEAAGGGDGAEGLAAGWTCLSTVGGDVFPRTVRSVAWNPDGRYGRPECEESRGYLVRAAGALPLCRWVPFACVFVAAPYLTLHASTDGSFCTHASSAVECITDKRIGRPIVPFPRVRRLGRETPCGYTSSSCPLYSATQYAGSGLF